jgi:hypothetical protein
MRNRFWSRKWGAFPLDEYRVWYGMIRRCCDRREPYFGRYGGRGIGVCDRWRHDFMAFLSDMGPRPGRGYSLDRIDNNGSYMPENCRWATRSQQSQNRAIVYDAAGITRYRKRWNAGMEAKTRAGAKLAYRRAARRRRVVSELSAAWAREAAALADGMAGRDEGELDRQLLDVLIRASRPPGYSGPRAKRPARVSGRAGDAKRARRPSRSSAPPGRRAARRR